MSPAVRWLPLEGADPIDGQPYWVACRYPAKVAPHTEEAFTAIGFWDSKVAGFRWNSGPLMNSAYAYAEIDFPAPPVEEKE